MWGQLHWGGGLGNLPRVQQPAGRVFWSLIAVVRSDNVGSQLRRSGRAAAARCSPDILLCLQLLLPSTLSPRFWRSRLGLFGG